MALTPFGRHQMREGFRIKLQMLFLLPSLCSRAGCRYAPQIRKPSQSPEPCLLIFFADVLDAKFWIEFHGDEPRFLYSVPNLSRLFPKNFSSISQRLPCAHNTSVVAENANADSQLISRLTVVRTVMIPRKMDVLVGLLTNG